MNIDLTKKQQACITHKGEELLIRGCVGSGKTLILALRALRFNRIAIENKKAQRIMLFVYNKTQVQAAKELLLKSPMKPWMINVSTIDNYAFKLYTEMHDQKKPHMLTAAERIDCVIKAQENQRKKAAAPCMLYEISAELLAGEFLWMKQKNISGLAEYVSATGKERLALLGIEEKDLSAFYELYEEYFRVYFDQDRLEWGDIYRYLLLNKDRISRNRRFDHVLIDEIQDLSEIKLKAARMLANVSFTAACDEAQKVTACPCDLSDAGLIFAKENIRDLEDSFRSTNEILDLSDSLLEVNRDNPLCDRFYMNQIPQDREGEIPAIFKCSDERSQKNTLFALARKELAKKKVTAILTPSDKELETLAKWLNISASSYETVLSPGFSQEKPGLKLLTFQQAKGLTFDAVLIPFFEREVFPDGKASENESDMALARTLLYTAMTRARESLYFTYSGKAASVFLGEFIPDFYNLYNDQGKPLYKHLRTYKPQSDSERN